MSDEHGFTNDAAKQVRVIAFREAAVADGWTIKPTYEGHESVDCAASLAKDGFKMMVLTRTDVGKWKYEAQITIWGPDGCQINVPENYDWLEIQRRVRVCLTCRKEVEQTHRVGFAGRACAECLPEERKKQEYPGWTN